MTRIYLAANLDRCREMEVYRVELERFGHSSVLYPPVGMGVGGTSILPYNEERGQVVATRNVEDLTSAEMLIAFTTGELSRGGRHVEFGIALALGTRIVLIGPLEHVFHCLDDIESYAVWDDFLVCVDGASSGPTTQGARSSRQERST